MIENRKIASLTPGTTPALIASPFAFSFVTVMKNARRHGTSNGRA